MESESGVYISGEWILTDERLTVMDLSSEEEFYELDAATEYEVDLALSCASDTESRLKESTIVERANWCEQIAQELSTNEEVFSETITREAGKPISSARGEVSSAIERFERAAEEARSIVGEYREGTTAGHEGWQSMVKPEPLGTTVVIGPYNYPLATVALQVAPAIAAGNPVVLKPASQTPLSAVLMTKAIQETDLPDGAFNLITGESSTIGDPLVSDGRVRLVSMVGSSSAGEHVANQTGLTSIHMELGGNAPALVLPDADIGETSTNCIAGSTKYAGQRCSAISRILAHEDIYDELVDELHEEIKDVSMGDPLDDPDMGPLIDESQAEFVESLVEDAVDRGATVKYGGEREGRWFEPTLLVDVPKDARIVSEEQFGPIACVTKVSSTDEMLEISEYGQLALDACLFSNNHQKIMELSNKLNTGTVRVNGAPSHGLGDVPFGGNQKSGIGRQGLHMTIEEMMTTKSIIF